MESDYQVEIIHLSSPEKCKFFNKHPFWDVLIVMNVSVHSFALCEYNPQYQEQSKSISPTAQPRFTERVNISVNIKPLMLLGAHHPLCTRSKGQWMILAFCIHSTHISASLWYYPLHQNHWNFIL